MTEVLTFANARQKKGTSHGTARSDNEAEFFNRKELNQILQVYSRRVMSGEWLDYRLSHDYYGAVFSIYASKSNLPIFSIVKHGRNIRRSGGRYHVLSHGRLMETAPALDEALRHLERGKLRLVDD